MSIYNDLICGKEKLAVVGLGYVGMPIAVEFAKHIVVDDAAERILQSRKR